MKSSQHQARKYSIRFTVGSMFILATLLTSFFAITIQYHFSRQMSEELVLSKLSMTSTQVSEHIQKIDSSASNVARLLKNISLVTEYQFSEEEVTTIFTQALIDNPMFYSIYWGNSSDDFFQIINLDSSPVVREKINAAESDRWVIIRVGGSKQNRIRKTYYYTNDFVETNVVIESSNYYPTQRPWYDEASTVEVFKTEPYLFQHLKIAGQTYAVKTLNAVIGIDIVLSSVSELISPTALGLTNSTGVESFIFNPHGEIIASSVALKEVVEIPSSQPLKLDNTNKAILKNARSLLVSNQSNWGPLDYAYAGQPKGYLVDLLKIVSEMTGLQFEYVNGFSWLELVDKYHQGELDILQSVPMIDRNDEILSVPLLSVPLGVASLEAKDETTDKKLLDLPVAVVEGRNTDTLLNQGLETKFHYASSIDEAMNLLEQGKVASVIDVFSVLQKYKVEHYLNDIHVTQFESGRPYNYYLTMKNSDRQLSNLIDLAISNVTKEQRQALDNKWLNRQNITDTFVPYAEVVDLTQKPSMQNQMIEHNINGENKYVYITAIGDSIAANEYFAVVVPEQVIFEKVIPKVLVTLGMSVMVLLGVLPLAWVFGNPIVKPVGLLTKETRKVSLRQFDKVHHVQSRIKEVSELSDSMVEMVEEIKNHQKSQEELVEAFIRLIAQAIDEKSPYTAGHCNRVPEIGMLLATAAENAQYGKFKNFKFSNDHERREFQIAAWLHDCGKITTPEHIVDKGTKLEANYNRIHEIRTRFEVLLRDAEISHLKRVYIEGVSEALSKEQLVVSKQQLKEEFEFIANSNVGGEYMADSKLERIQDIAKRTWQRNFDDSLGLSPFEELARDEEFFKQSLPVTEQLLSDKQEHIIKRIRPLEFDPKLGIKLNIPKNQYNLGEVYNLSVRAGTLTAEDRFKINEHMTSGIKMLNNIPFPPELSRVPRYASTHHETLKGTGYPRQLTKDQLSIPERILSIADVFEALTAADRPYKKAKPVSVAIDIMYKMAMDEHLDIDLFILFLESGVYMEYAKRYLPEAQIDNVDVQKYQPSESVNKQKVTKGQAEPA
ncbi:transporter substrate-binding domain-containing protein [Vibrio lamellibrachiae]|uniref:HD domain-containing phosphohydrolase n=1 Tax=Vibrio lamellibrachiae TaxID=2910253 RepID=UPI003D0A5BF0